MSKRICYYVARTIKKRRLWGTNLTIDIAFKFCRSKVSGKQRAEREFQKREFREKKLLA